jgi:tRNA pseudouridine13 synthase
MQGRPAVRHLQEQEVGEGGGALMYRVVLPMPGHDVEYPTTAIGDVYKDLLESDGITSFGEDFTKQDSDLALRGSYRPLLVRRPADRPTG